MVRLKGSNPYGWLTASWLTAVHHTTYNEMLAKFFTKHTVTLGALSCATSIATGAYGSHGLPLSKTLTEREKKSWEAANKYQFLHSLAMVALPAACPPALYPKCFVATGQLFAAGQALFSGSIYAKVLLLKRAGKEKEGTKGREEMVGMATGAGKGAPFGGVFLMAGWLCLALLRRG